MHFVYPCFRRAKPALDWARLPCQAFSLKSGELAFSIATSIYLPLLKNPEHASQPVNILQISKFSFLKCFGGIEQAVKNIVLDTSKRGCCHTILVTDTVSDIQEDNLGYATLVRFPTTFTISSCPVSIPLLKHFKDYVAKADIIHYHSPWPFSELLHIMGKVKKPSLVTYHSDIIKQMILKQFYNPFMQRFLSSLDKIVATSQNYLYSSTSLRDFKKKSLVIPLGIDEKNYPHATEEKLLYWKNRFNHKFILFIGVLRYYKGLPTLLNALKNSDISLVIIGTGHKEKELKKQATLLHLKNIHFLGAIRDEDKIALLQLCRAVVLPSHLRSEALGLALIEGLLFGKPLISTDIGTGTSFVNQHGVTGFVVPPEDPRALKESMLRLLNEDETAERMGQQSRKRYEQLFTSEKTGNAYYDLYQAINKGPPHEKK